MLEYCPNRREITWETTVAEEKTANIHVGRSKSRKEFNAFREPRDATLDLPKLIFAFAEVNMRTGDMPKSEEGKPVLKVPINII